MPTDHAAETLVVAAPMKKVLATIRDVGNQPKWVPEIRTEMRASHLSG